MQNSKHISDPIFIHHGTYCFVRCSFSGERKSTNNTTFYITDFVIISWQAWQLWKDGLWLQLVDESLDAEYRTLGIMRCINIALLCVQENASDRPTMSDVVAMLSSKAMTLSEPKHPAYLYVRVREEAASVVVPCSVNDVTVSALDGR